MVMRVLITGAAGGIGSVLTDKLLENGHDLILVDDLSGGRIENIESSSARDSLVRVDLRQSDFPQEAYNCDVIVHLAAISSLAQCQKDPQKAFDVNLGVTAKVAELARVTGAHLIFASTSAVYENNGVVPFREDDTVSPELTYSQTKWLAEQYLQREAELLGLDITVLRFFNVFGPRQDLSRPNPPLVNYLVRELTLGRRPKIYAPDMQARDYVHVSDVVALIELCMSRRPRKYNLYNVCSGQTISIRTLLEQVAVGLTGEGELAIERGEPMELWDMHPLLFEGRHPLPKQRVESETLKTSLGSPEKTLTELGWSAQIDVATAVREESSVIAERVLLEFGLANREA